MAPVMQRFRRDKRGVEIASPLVLDLVLFLDLASRAGVHGIQEWLSFYFKSPMTAPDLYPEHDILIHVNHPFDSESPSTPVHKVGSTAFANHRMAG